MTDLDPVGALTALQQLADDCEGMETPDIRRRLRAMLGPATLIGLACCDEVQLVGPMEQIRACPGMASSIDRIERSIRAERRANPPELRVADQGEGVSMAGILASAGCPVAPSDDYTVPGGYEIHAGAIYRIDGEDRRTLLAGDLIAVVGRSIDAEGGTVTLELAWRYAGRWTVRPVPRSRALTRDGLLGLIDDGLPGAQQTASALTGYIDACDRELDTPPGVSMCRLGWRPDGLGYAWGGTPVGEPVSVTPPGAGESEELDRYGEAGTWEEWTAEVWDQTCGYPAEIVILASLAAPLLHVVGAQGWTLDVGGPKGRGKTTSQRAAASCWGSPMTVVPWPKTWAGMRNTVEFRADIPTILDDTKAVIESRDGLQMIRDLLYQVAGERSQVLGSQGGGTRATRLVRTLAISSGESPIAMHLRNAEGASQRILTLGSAPYPEDHRALVQGIERATRHHYGHAGPRLVQWLVDRREGWPDLERRYRAHVDRRAEAAGTDAGGRLALRIAVLDLVAEILPEALGLDPSPGCVDRFARHAMRGYTDRDNPTEALQAIVAHVASRPGQVSGWGWSQESHQPMIAAVNVERAMQCLVLDASWTEDMLRRGGWTDPGSIIRQWLGRDWLDPDIQQSSGRTVRRSKRRIAVEGRSAARYVLTPEAWELGKG